MSKSRNLHVSRPTISTYFVCVVFLAGHVDAEPSASNVSPAALLANMPMNSDKRCTGICLVAAALLDGERLSDSDCDQAEELSRQVFKAAEVGSRLRYHSQLCVDGKRLPIGSREALDGLSTAVADLYKEHYFELIATPEGRDKLRSLYGAFLKAPAELDQILDADSDGIDAFFLMGARKFPDGNLKDTNHVVLLAKENGRVVVYDPNDPGAAIPCKFDEDGGKLTIQWTCKYRDTGQVTTQTYQIISKKTYFRLALKKE
jgi:hypothetical protein